MANASFQDTDIVTNAFHTYKEYDLEDATGRLFGSIAIDTSRRGMKSSLLQDLPSNVKVIGLSFAPSAPIPGVRAIKPPGEVGEFILYSIMTITATESLCYILYNANEEALEWRIMENGHSLVTPPPSESILTASEDRIAFYVWAGFFE